MKVLLVNPLWTRKNIIPLNLAELAGYIRALGNHELRILDLNYELREDVQNGDIIGKAVELIIKCRPDIVGITCNTIHLPFCSELCRALKKQVDFPIVLGGIHSTFAPDRVLKLTKADFIVRGEGEETFLELLETIGHHCKTDNIRGLSFIGPGGSIIHNPSRPLIPDLSKLPFPAYDLLSAYAKKAKRFSFQEKTFPEISISAGRGCPFGCIFCSGNKMWHYQRRKSIERIIEEIYYIKRHYRYRRIHFADDCLPFDKKWFWRFLSEVKRQDILWTCYARIDTIDAQMIRKMRDAGCMKIYHGIESGSPRVRDFLSKKMKNMITNKKIISLIREEIKVGIKPVCSFIANIPTETKREMLGTIEMAFGLRKIGADSHYHLLVPFPGLKITENYKDRLIKINKWKYFKKNSVYFFEQIYLYRDFYHRYINDNPDFFIFKPEIEMNEFINIFNEGRKKIEDGMIESDKKFGYFEDTSRGLYFVEKAGRKKLRKVVLRKGILDLFLPRAAKKGKGVDVKNAKEVKPEKYLLSFKCRHRQDAIENTGYILKIIIELIGKGVKVGLTRPLPSEVLNKFSRKVKTAICLPSNCKECLELFRINKKNKVVLCTGNRVCDKVFAPAMGDIYELFLKSAKARSEKNVAYCTMFPDKKAQGLLKKKEEKANENMRFGKEYFTKNIIKKSIFHLQKALSYGYRENDIHFLLGLCYEKTKKYKQAIEELTVAESINPSLALVNLSLANCYRNIGEMSRSNIELGKTYKKISSQNISEPSKNENQVPSI